MAAAVTAAILRWSSGRVLCSAVVCKPVTWSCMLRIDGYSHLSQLLANRERVESPAFDVGHLSWCLRLFRNGDTTESRSHIAVYLRLESNPSGERVSARAKFSVLDRHGNPAGFVHDTVSRNNFKRGHSWGCSKWIAREELERSGGISWTTASPSSATPPSQWLETVVIT
ncbi:uncharacterized protein LOC112890480 [Panicum hallii]|uniref:uncharacterized protein LOC112890480 n=1 Tax=Panicum hallii TaxID=206008 RepID=UPI000DF4D996|nr:uncharacterized protein LOC112890480 [Panicum hallii]